MKRTINELRKEIKTMGFKVSVKTLSWGPHATFKDKTGHELPDIFLGEQDLNKWKPLIQYLNTLTEVTNTNGEKVYGCVR